MYDIIQAVIRTLLWQASLCQWIVQTREHWFCGHLVFKYPKIHKMTVKLNSKSCILIYKTFSGITYILSIYQSSFLKWHYFASQSLYKFRFRVCLILHWRPVGGQWSVQTVTCLCETICIFTVIQTNLVEYVTQNQYLQWQATWYEKQRKLYIIGCVFVHFVTVVSVSMKWQFSHKNFKRVRHTWEFYNLFMDNPYASRHW